MILVSNKIPPCRRRSVGSNRIIVLAALCMVVLAVSCAVKGGQLQGGERDETPPVILEEKSTANFQTQFKERTIVLSMDEWVKLENPFTQVLISPPLEKRPDISIKGKSVIVKFDEEEVLRENATYSINFGEAIQDITENNPLKNYSFVFSTGTAIDSLQISGTIIDAYTAEPVEDALVMVYESAQDSIIYKEKPFYASRSQEDGSFTIKNMKEGSFKVVAIMDENLNYLYDPPTESLAFLSTVLVLDGDSFPFIQLQLSLEREDLYLSKKDTSGWNRGIFTYNRTPLHLVVDIDSTDSDIYYDLLDEEIFVWYHSDARTSWPLYLRDTFTVQTDTLSLRRNTPPAPTPSFEKKARIRNSGHPSDPYYLCFDTPLSVFDTTYLIIVEGTSDTISPELLILDSLPLCLEVSYAWKPDSIYQVTLLPGALVDIYGLPNDTITDRYPIGNVERFGEIQLTVDSLDGDQAYIIELLLKDKPEVTLYAEGQETLIKSIYKLKPGDYELRVTEDANRNHLWDPADYLAGRQPEHTHKTSVETLRSNWEIEVQYIWTRK
ncbi:MAG: hypothetical protein HKN87_06610 [Saprospiraceae bacterium]|nr:hypothetical protein [Saprospiraceae bacterium]